MSVRLLVCGGRGWGEVPMNAPPSRITEAQRERLFTFMALGDFGREYGIEHIISGAAKGADRLGVEFAKTHGIPFTEYPADWVQHGKRAGILRNEEMLRKGLPNYVIAFPGGRGTAHMIKIAREARIVVWRPLGAREAGG